MVRKTESGDSNVSGAEVPVPTENVLRAERVEQGGPAVAYRSIRLSPNSSIDDVAREMLGFFVSPSSPITHINIDFGSNETVVTATQSAPNSIYPASHPPGEFETLLQSIELYNVSRESAPKINSRSLRIVCGALNVASLNGKAAIAWLVQDITAFMRWLGVRVHGTPSRFMNVPIVTSSSVPEDKLILLVGNTSAAHPFEAESGVVITLEEG